MDAQNEAVRNTCAEVSNESDREKMLMVVSTPLEGFVFLLTFLWHALLDKQVLFPAVINKHRYSPKNQKNAESGQ